VTVELHDFVENRKLMAILLLGLGLLVLALDILNPFTEFVRTWNIVYILANFLAYLAMLAPIYIILGFLVEREDTAKLYFTCLWIPIVHYLLKGFLLLYMISEDPALLVTMGTDIGWTLFDWRDFAVFYYGSFPLYVVAVWAFTVVFMVLGVMLNLTFGEGIRKAARKVFKAVKGV
jgi:hypothetical protein